MVSVTQRIKEIKQPYGGYLRPSTMDKVQLANKEELYPVENIHPTKNWVSCRLFKQIHVKWSFG
jgi:hypothetical protein